MFVNRSRFSSIRALFSVRTVLENCCWQPLSVSIFFFVYHCDFKRLSWLFLLAGKFSAILNFNIQTTSVAFAKLPADTW